MAKKSSLHQQRSRVGVFFAAPALILVSAFLGIPIIQAGYFSFTEWNGIEANWLGFSAYIQEFKNPIFWRVLENNGLLLLGVPVAILFPMGIAF